MVIAVSNQKGGTAKTTTAQAIATGAAKFGRLALAVDLDPQGNLSFCMGGNSADLGIYELLTGAATPGQVIQTTRQGDIITANSTLALADTMFKGDERIYALRNALRPLKSKYDVIVIDCPPSFGTLLINALAAADRVILPLTADIFSLQGLYQLHKSIEDARRINPALTSEGVLFVKHRGRTVLARDMVNVISAKCADLGIKVYSSAIRDGIAVREAQVQRESLFDYSPRSNPAVDYKNFLTELFTQEG